MIKNNEHFNELSFYTLPHPDSVYFIHQLVVDAFTAQTANENTKRISLVFSLVGLYLLIEKNYTGREIQRAHTLLSNHKDFLPEIKLPSERGNITIIDVLNNKSNRDKLIKEWCFSVWEQYKTNNMKKIKEYCENYLSK
ncbi:DUF5946 family protein [Tenacibaculum insulae]|uniref:DUF5946 family protein n=1 Tax=Tenacibaculum insulae TaxID=2029677 RepID=UPI003AB78C44